MSVRTLLILRGAVAILMMVFAVMAFADGRTFVGVLLTAFVLTNLVLIAVLANRQTGFTWRFLGIFRARR